MATKPGWPTDPEVLAFIEETALHYPEASNRASANDSRNAYNALCAAFDYPHPDGVTAEDSTVNATKPKRKIPIRTYRDADENPDLDIRDEQLQKIFGAEEIPASTCLMYLHGGGWIVGDLDSHDSICAELCASSALDVVAVDYRLCPEHRYPAALDDAEAVYRTLENKYDQVVVGGDSAGGHLAAALCLRLRNKKVRMPAAQLLIYPALGAMPEGGSYETNANAPGLTTSDTIHYWGILADGDSWRTTTDAELAPLRAKSFENLPPAIITSAGCDPLRDDAMQYVARLTEAGVPVQYRNDPQLIHGHLRGRYMIGAAMAHFVWITLALSDVAMTGDIENLLSDSDFAALLDD